MQSARPLIIRADANAEIGVGHAMRCFALAQAWQRMGRMVCFVMAGASTDFQKRLRDEDFSLRTVSSSPGSSGDVAETLAIVSQLDCAAVVLDGYQFDADYQHKLKEGSPKLLCLDDYGHAGSYCADFILNQNLLADTTLYSDRAPYTRLLLGTRFALLRQEFKEKLGRKAQSCDKVQTILVTMGGADRENVTLKVIEALQQLNVDALEAVVVVGGDNPNCEALYKSISECETKNRGIRIRLDRDVRDMSALMASTDLAISAAGSTSWELSFMGVPALLVALADNQRPIADSMNAAGVAVSLGWHENVTPEAIALNINRLMSMPEERMKMGNLGRVLVDGEGVDEVVMRLDGGRLGLRRACEDDCEIIWKWANDPIARQFSFSKDLISWNSHVDWYHERLVDNSCTFFIADNDDGVPVGQVRFNILGEGSVISVGVDPNVRGKGYGSEIIRFASRRFFGITDINEISAYIKVENEQSLHAFRRAGFVDSGETEIRGARARRMILRRKDRS